MLANREKILVEMIAYFKAYVHDAKKLTAEVMAAVQVLADLQTELERIKK